MQNRMRFRAVAIASLLLTLAVGALYFFKSSQPLVEQTKVTVNEAAHTLLYLPLYYAADTGIFQRNGLDLDIITGGTATASFSAMMAGEADFSIADPMYVPISREQGARSKVVGQIVARIALWALTRDSAVTGFSREAIEGKSISTHLRPMSAYTYTLNYVTQLGLVDGADVNIIQNRPGSELAPFLAGDATFVVTPEPGASVAEAAGARVIYSWPQMLGERVLSAMMTREEVIASRRPIVEAFVKSIKESLADMRARPEAAKATARKYFPQLSEDVVSRAVDRLIREQVFPATTGISEESWKGAVSARKAVGDIKGEATYADSVDVSFR